MNTSGQISRNVVIFAKPGKLFIEIKSCVLRHSPSSKIRGSEKFFETGGMKELWRFIPHKTDLVVLLLNWSVHTQVAMDVARYCLENKIKLIIFRAWGYFPDVESPNGWEGYSLPLRQRYLSLWPFKELDERIKTTLHF